MNRPEQGSPRLSEKWYNHQMLPPTHLAGGYLIGRLTEKRSQLSPFHWTSVTSFFSVFPDIDLLWLWESHRFSLLHFPSFWISIFLALRIISAVTKKSWIGDFAFAMLLGSLSHVVLDSIGIFEGIYWLYPLNTAKYSVLPITIMLPSHSIFAMMVVYFQHPLIILETALCAAAAGYEWRQGIVTDKLRTLFVSSSSTKRSSGSK